MVQLIKEKGGMVDKKHYSSIGINKKGGRG